MRSSSRAGIRRRPRLAALFALLMLLVIPGCARAADVPPGPGSGGYLAFADRLQPGLEPLWDEAAGRYRSGQRETEAMLNGNLLLTHAVAALKGHTGPARNDHRARLVAAPSWRVRRSPHGSRARSRTRSAMRRGSWTRWSRATATSTW
jgi:hypothetical protein